MVKTLPSQGRVNVTNLSNKDSLFGHLLEGAGKRCQQGIVKVIPQHSFLSFRKKWSQPFMPFLLFFSHIYFTRESNPSKKKPKTSIVHWAFPSLKWDKWASITTSAKGGPDLRGEPWKGIESKVIAEGRVGSQCKDADTTAHQNGDVEDDIYSVLWLRCPQC